jgi:predicted transcriptional regulator
LRACILTNLKTGQKTVNQISTETGINWKTVDNHLIYLIGKGFVREVFSSPYVKIYEITERGKQQLEGTK